MNHGHIYAFNEKPLSAFRIWEETKTTTGRYKFLLEIRKILLNHGAIFFSPNISHTYWYEAKDLVKRVIGYKK